MTFTGADASPLQAAYTRSAQWGQRAIRNIRLVSELPNEAAHFETCAIETAIMAAHCALSAMPDCDHCGLPAGLDPVDYPDALICASCAPLYVACDHCGGALLEAKAVGRATDRLRDAWTSETGQFHRGCR